MPLYLFSNPKNGEVVEVMLPMNSSHEFIDSEGVKWDRVFVKPQMAVDTKIDAFNKQDFVNKTRGKMKTFGEVFDASGELSQKRTEKAGVDPLKQKYYENYKLKRKGKEHQDIRKQKGKESLNKMGVDIIE